MHGRRSSDERGFTLIEVVMAGVLMLAVLVPASLLLAGSTKALNLNQAKVVASNLLSGVLEEDRVAVDAQGAAAVLGWSGSPIAPSLPALSSVKVGGVTYTLQRQGSGWCFPQLFEGVTVWGDSPTTDGATLVSGEPPAYGEYVTVSWLGGSHSLAAGQVFATPAINSAVSHANPPATSSTCPL